VSFTNNVDLRAPIFYDSNNTAYYVDPASGSYLYGLTLSGGAYFRPNNWIELGGDYGIYSSVYNSAHFLANIASSYGQWRIIGSRNGFGGIYDTYSAVNGIMYDSSGNGGVYREANGRWYWYYNVSTNCMGIGTSNTNSAYNIYCPTGVYSGGRVDGTIFYDSNDTGYFCDPSSTSILNIIGFNGTSGNAFGNYWAGTSGYPAYQFIGGNSRFGFSSTSGYVDVYTDGNYYGGIDLYGANRLVPLFDANQGGGALYSSIVYDSNDTGYYSDPNGRSNLYQATFATGLQFSGAFVLVQSGATLDNSTGMRLTENYGAVWNGSNGVTWNHQVINASSLVGFLGSGGNFGSGNILATGNVTAYYSDERLKTKITTIENALDKVKSLEGFIYVENALAKSLGYTNGEEQAGLSAQRVKAVLPQAVSLAPFDMQGVPETGDIISKSGENYLTVDYSRLVPLLIEAIKELSAQVDELKKGS
jgi:hypothetical protein